MPYAGITPGSDLEKNIERCVKKVMAKNPSYSKSKAIAICRASIDKKDADMSKPQKTRGGKTARQRRKEAQKKIEEVMETAEEMVEEIMEEALAEEGLDDVEDIVEDILEEEIEMTDEIPEDTDSSDDELAQVLEAAAENEEETNVQKMLALIAKKLGIGQPAKKDCAIEIIKNTKDITGEFPYRWVGKVSGNFKDRDGEIITREAHEEYVSWLHNEVFDKRPSLAPEFRTWHTPGTGRKARADAAAFINGFLVMSGALTESEASALVKASEKYDLGMSHGFVGVKSKVNPSHYIRYRSFEVSDLPLKFAAYPWSSLKTIQKEALFMSKDKDYTEHLETILGEEMLKEIEADTELAQDNLRALQVEEKESDPPQEEAITDGDAQTQEKASKEQVLGTLVQQIMPIILKEIGIDELSAYVEETRRRTDENTKQITVTQKSDADRLAEMIEAPVSRQFAWNKRPSQSKETILKETDDEDKKLKESGPGIPEGDEFWLSKASNTQPLPEEAVQH